MDELENPLERDYSLSVVLPGGLEKNATVHGSKPVMDLLVTLCASYHLNPSDYTVEFLSPNKNNISFKPNSPIGSLEADKIVLKPKVVEEIKIRRPYMPEASVRLLINYNKSHKAVVRVNPRVPLETLLPVVCDKCEFPVETTVLLRDSESRQPLDLTQTLNDHGLREVFAKDTADKRKTPEAELISPPPPPELPKKEKKRKDNTGFLSLFRRRRNKGNATEGAGSAPASPGRSKQVGVGMNAPGVSSSNNLPTDVPKKRRAPQPPMNASLSVPNNLSSCHVGGSQRSAESTLKRTKRRAPAPPCTTNHQELQADTENKDSLNKVEELKESEESDSEKSSSSSSPRPASSFSSPSLAHLQDMSHAYLPSFRGKDFSDARCALAKVLTSSISSGALVKRLKNSFGPTTQRGSRNGLFCAELEPVQASRLPTEDEWEDPVQRKGMTTFKVVPSKSHKSHDPDPDPVKLNDNPEMEASPEPEGLPCSPNTSETVPQSPEPSSDLDHQDPPQSSPPPEVTEEATVEVEPEGTPAEPSGTQSESPDVDLSGSSTDEAEEAQQDEDDFPPPPPPAFFNESMEDEQQDAPASPDETINELSDDPQPETTSPATGSSAAPSRFAQAVAMAVQRSRLRNAGKSFGLQGASGDGHRSLPPPPRTTYQYGA